MSERSKKSVDEDALGYHERKDGTVVISYYGRAVTTLRGKEATKFTRRVEALEGREEQLLMARATGNFKWGNERKS
ncbi:MAG: hypothetical protein M3475_03775 [Actinomycetota bacterium]|nr:hypothetical protein [Actinomycetota bacterium]